MPKIWPILSQAFTGLFTTLGIQAQPSGTQWFLSDTLIPVSIVDSQITLIAEAVPRLYQQADIFDGISVAPTAGTVVVDTGQLAAGNYDCQLRLSVFSSVDGSIAELRHRNAANSANIWGHECWITSSAVKSGINNFDFSLRIEANERLQVLVSGVNFAAAERISAVLFVKARA